jgi:hypothetical protein
MSVRTWASDDLKRKSVVPESAIVDAFAACVFVGKDKFVLC